MLLNKNHFMIMPAEFLSEQTVLFLLINPVIKTANNLLNCFSKKNNNEHCEG